jgi:tryptophan halogenase
MTKFKFVVVGGGTAGAIAASYLKKYWGDTVEVIMVFDHSKPSIGVGESLTPMIWNYLNYVGITVEEMIQHTNSTVKIGIKFKNWLNDGSYFYHPFLSLHDDTNIGKYNYTAAYELVNGIYDNDKTYSNIMFEENRLPYPFNSTSSALHIDATLFGDFIINKFKDGIKIIDDTVLDVSLKGSTNEIDYIICSNNGRIDGDFFIDATGLESILFNKLKGNTWKDTKDWFPLDRFIPNPVYIDNTQKQIPVYTTAEATENGWILQVPLSNRWGTGYLFSSEFTRDEEAIEKFDKFLSLNYNSNLSTPKVRSFKSGYWEKQWNGNCICIGLSSGFSEPLEATNIHQCIVQLKLFVNRFNFKVFEFDINEYNKSIIDFYNRAYLFIRYCYTTERTDSEFWKYMTNNVPYEVKCLDEKLKYDFLNVDSMSPNIFNYDNFFKICAGLKKHNIENYKNILSSRQVIPSAQSESLYLKQYKDSLYNNSISHKDFINSILMG